jgi:DNA-binding transcriptional LysR family regulator
MKALAHGAEPQGLFRLGLANGLCDDTVSSAVAEVFDGFGRISLHLKTGWSGELAELHRQGQLDAAIVLGDAPPADAAVIGTEELAVIAAPQFADRWRTGGFTLADMPWVLSPEPCDARRLLASHIGRRHLPVTGELDDPRLQLAWVRRGAGASLLPRRLLEAAGEGVEEIEIAGLALRLPVVLLASPHLGARVAVVDALAARLAGLFKRAFETPGSRPGRYTPKRSVSETNSIIKGE